MTQCSPRLLAVLVVSFFSLFFHVPARAQSFRAELTPLPGGQAAELRHPGRPGARYVLEESATLTGPWSTALSYYGTAASLSGGQVVLTVPLPPPPPPGPPAPEPPPVDADYEFWLWKAPDNRWTATLYLRRVLGSKPVWRPVHRKLAAGRDWSFNAIVRPGGTRGLPWVGNFEIPPPSGGKWIFRLHLFSGLTSIPDTADLVPEEEEAFARLEGAWQAIASKLASTAPPPPGPPLPPGKKQFYRVRELLVDTDGDGLLDVDELAGPNPTDPFNPDTDGDGQYDGDTPAAQDPLLADEDADGLPDVEDAVPYDNAILWPKLRLQYAWAPLPDGWIPASLNNKGHALLVKEDTGLAAGRRRWRAARLEDGVISTQQVVFHDTQAAANPASDIRYQLKPLGLADTGAAVFGHGPVSFPHRYYNYSTGQTETGPEQASATLNAVWKPQTTSLLRVLPPGQTAEAAGMTGRAASVELGSQAPQNILALTASHAGLMDGSGRLYAGVQDGNGWPLAAQSNSASAPAGSSRTARGSGLIWPAPDGSSAVTSPELTFTPAFWTATGGTGLPAKVMRSYDAVSRAGKIIWRQGSLAAPYDPSAFHSSAGDITHTFGSVSAPPPGSQVPQVTALSYTPALPLPALENGLARSWFAIADMEDFPEVEKDPLTGQVLPRTDGPLVISRAFETFVRRKTNPAQAGSNVPHKWQRLSLRRGRGLSVIDGIDYYNPNYTPKYDYLRTAGRSGTHAASALGQVLAYRSELWQNGAVPTLASLCQPADLVAGTALTSRLMEVWHQEINDEGLIAAEGWKNPPSGNVPTVWEGGLCVPYEIEIPDSLPIGEERWASLSLPEHFLTTRNLSLTWWKRANASQAWTLATPNPATLTSDETGRAAFPVKTATAAASPWNAPGDLPNAQPGEQWQARITVPRTNTLGGVWFTCLSAPVTILPGEPEAIEIITPIPSGSNAWVADNQSEFPVTVQVKDKKGNPVADGTEVTMDLYGTASTRPVHGSEAPAFPGQTEDEAANHPVFLTESGAVTLTFRTFLTTTATAVIRAGSREKELTIEYRGVQGTLTSAHSTLNTTGTGGTTTATLSLTTPVKNGTPVVWTVSRYAPGGVPLSAGVAGFDSARRTVQGVVVHQTASLPINATGAATGLCVVTATVAEKLFLHTIQFNGGVGFSAGLDREVLVADRKYLAGQSRDYQMTAGFELIEPASQYNGTSLFTGRGPVTLSTAANGTIQGSPGRAYRVTVSQAGRASGFQIAPSPAEVELINPHELTVFANAQGTATFHLRSSGQPSSPSYTGCVALEVRDMQTNATTLLQTGATTETVGVLLYEAYAGFTGLGDVRTLTGATAAFWGGMCSVNDIGGLLKNSARFAGVTNGEVDALESGLCAIGLATTAATVGTAGTALPVKMVVSTLKAIRSILPKTTAFLVRALKDWIIEPARQFRHWGTLDFIRTEMVTEAGLRSIRWMERAVSSKAHDILPPNLRASLGEGRANHLCTSAGRVVNDLGSQAAESIVTDSLKLIDLCNDETKLFLAGADNLTEAKEFAASLTSLVRKGMEAGGKKPFNQARLRKLLDNKHLLRPPVPGMTGGYRQVDLLRDINTIAAHTDSEGMLRLMKALTARNQYAAPGNRYALQVTADYVTKLAQTGGAQIPEGMSFISKWTGKWGLRGSAEIDWLVKEGNQWVVTEIKSSRGALNRDKFVDWLGRVKISWNTTGLGGTPKFKLVTPLPESAMPDWFNPLKSQWNISYETGPAFK